MLTPREKSPLPDIFSIAISRVCSAWKDFLSQADWLLSTQTAMGYLSEAVLSAASLAPAGSLLRA